MKDSPIEIYVGPHGIREVYERAIDPTVPDYEVVECTRRVGPDCSQGSARPTPFRNGTFDAALLATVLGALVGMILALLLGVDW